MAPSVGGGQIACSTCCREVSRLRCEEATGDLAQPRREARSGPGPRNERRRGDGSDWRGRREGSRQRSWVPGESGVGGRDGDPDYRGERCPLKRLRQCVPG